MYFCILNNDDDHIAIKTMDTRISYGGFEKKTEERKQRLIKAKNIFFPLLHFAFFFLLDYRREKKNEKKKFRGSLFTSSATTILTDYNRSHRQRNCVVDAETNE